MIVMDNLGAHTGAGIRESMESHGAQVIDVPPSAPALAPLEPCWSQVTTGLCAAQARTRAALEHALVQACATVTAVDARHWFAHCGYPIQ